LIGGALGVALGWVIGRAINFGTNVYLHRMKMPAENLWTVPPWLVVGAIGFAVLVISFMLYVTFFDFRRLPLFKSLLQHGSQVEEVSKPAPAGSPAPAPVR